MLYPAVFQRDLAPVLTNFAEQGFAHLGPVMTNEALAELRARSDDLMLGRVTYPGMFFQRDTDTGRFYDLQFGRGYEGPGLFYRKIEKLELDPVFWKWINNPFFGKIANSVIGNIRDSGNSESGANEIAIYRAVLFTKAAEGGTDLPWHQDGGKFWGLDRDPVLQIWTALDDAPEEAGAVQVLPGSHKAGLATPLGGVVPERFVREHNANARAVALPAKAGEAMLIHNQLWHKSGVNKTGRIRRALTVCYMDAATQCLRKKRAPRNFVRVFRDL